jgi:hypothetical protein
MLFPVFKNLAIFIPPPPYFSRHLRVLHVESRSASAAKTAILKILCIVSGAYTFSANSLNSNAIDLLHVFLPSSKLGNLLSLHQLLSEFD